MMQSKSPKRMTKPEEAVNNPQELEELLMVLQIWNVIQQFKDKKLYLGSN